MCYKLNLLLFLISGYFSALKLLNRQFSQQIFSCPNNCNRRYKSKSALARHLKLECGKEPQFQCNICFKKFSQRTTLRAHCGVKHGLIL